MVSFSFLCVPSSPDVDDVIGILKDLFRISHNEKKKDDGQSSGHHNSLDPIDQSTTTRPSKMLTNYAGSSYTTHLHDLLFLWFQPITNKGGLELVRASRAPADLQYVLETC